MNSIFIRSFLALVLFSACGLAVHASEPARSKPIQGAARFEPEIAAFEKWDRQNASPKNAILFVGSSSIRNWQTAEAFPDLPVINRGFGGSSISDVNHFFDRIVPKYNPRVIVFYSGDNDIAGGKSSQQTFDDFQKFVQLVHDELPETRVVVLSIKPSIARLKLWPTMKEANALLAKLAEEDAQVEYVDIATPMLDADGQPRKELFLDDGLHINAAGYDLWNETLLPALSKQNVN